MACAGGPDGYVLLIEGCRLRQSTICVVAIGSNRNKAPTGVGHGASMTQFERARLIDERRLAQLATEAAVSARRRSHILLHANHQDQVQRLLIALEPDSYVRPHLHSEQWEMIVLLRGRLDLLIFGPEAELVQRLAVGTGSPVAQIRPGTWHSGVALQPETLVLEVKPGPYRPNEFAEWAPQEGERAAAAFVSWAGEARLGSKWSAQYG
jgi:cupin fold WbuC family metalloprotein